MATQRDKQFKLDAVQYYLDHKDLGVRGCAENLGVGYSTLTRWLKNFREAGADWPNSVHQKSADCKPEFQPAISTGRLNFSLQSSQIHALNFLLLYVLVDPHLGQIISSIVMPSFHVYLFLIRILRSLKTP